MGLFGRAMWLFLFLFSGAAMIMGFGGTGLAFEGVGLKGQGAGELFIGGVIGFSVCLWSQLVEHWSKQ